MRKIPKLHSPSRGGVIKKLIFPEPFIVEQCLTTQCKGPEV